MYINQMSSSMQTDENESNVPQQTTMCPFDGSKSASSAETIMDFLESFTWKDCQVKDIPGIGPKSAESLAKSGISTVQQLMGTYMGFVEPDAESNEINNKFYQWFKKKSPNANSHTVTFAVAHLADKYGIVLYEA